MANTTYGYREPLPIAVGGYAGFQWDRAYPTPNTNFRRGAILINSTTGSNTTPAQTGSMAALAGPPASAVTLTTTTSSGAPASTVFFYVAYSATSNESLPSGPFIVNAPAGYVAQINVSATGAPAAATNYVVYAGYIPTYAALQNTSRTTTLLGTAFAVANPLTNYISAANAASNATTGIIGLAAADSNAYFNSGPGGATTVGNQSLFGATQSFPPLDSLGAYGIPVVKFQTGMLVEMSLKQAWYPSLLNASVGITLDATSGWFIADTGASAAGVIAGISQGPAPFFGNVTDIGARVQVRFNASALA